MIREDAETATFNEMAEVLNFQVDSKQLSVKCTVLRFTGFEFLGKEGDWVPHVIDVLLKDSSHSGIRRVHHNAGRCLRFRMREQGGIGKCVLDGHKGCCSLVRPTHGLLVSFGGRKQVVEWP